MEIRRPLAYRARPKTIDEIVGQIHLVGENGVIRRMISNEKSVNHQKHSLLSMAQSHPIPPHRH